MYRLPRTVARRLLLAGLCLPLAALPTQTLQAQASVRAVKVLGSKDAIEIEVEASDRVVPQTQVLTGPDRLVVDFPNAVPGRELYSQSVNRGQVKDVRVGLFQSKPPVTRVVLDLKAAQSYQVFPYGRTVIIKIMGGTADGPADMDASNASRRPGLVSASYNTGSERIRIENMAKPLEVSFHDGLLTIRANKATLSEVLYAVQQRTGAEVAIAAGAEQERVVVDLGPAPAQEVLSSLLNGSRFNFLILNSANNPKQLDRVILTPRTDGGSIPLPPAPNADLANDDAPGPAQAQAGNPAVQNIQRPQAPEVNAQPDDGHPD